jgi:eukaryotic-like serine/threonine-protein kinase
MKTIGKYEILELLGQGAMGKVYRARQPILDEVVALKILSPIDEFVSDKAELKSRFLQEAKILWRLRHRHIIPITDVDMCEEMPFYVMEYLPESLADGLGLGDGTRKSRGLMPEKEVLRIGGEILKALSCLHENGIVHRDLKPHNILLAENGSVRLADFGIAKLIGKTGLTKTGGSWGTHEFMAPEQKSDSRNVDGRADLYAFTMVLYMLLTGQHPFDARFKLPSVLNTKIAKGWDDVFDKGTQPVPENRYGSAEEMLRALRDVVGASKEKRRVSAAEKIPRDIPAPPPPPMPTPPSEHPSPITNSIGMAFVWIRPGTFMMGSPEDEAKRNSSETLHEVTLSKGYYLQTTPVT